MCVCVCVCVCVCLCVCVCECVRVCVCVYIEKGKDSAKPCTKNYRNGKLQRMVVSCIQQSRKGLFRRWEHRDFTPLI